MTFMRGPLQTCPDPVGGARAGRFAVLERDLAVDDDARLRVGCGAVLVLLVEGVDRPDTEAQKFRRELVEGGLQHVGGVDVEAGELLGVRAGDPLRGKPQAVAVGVVAIFIAFGVKLPEPGWRRARRSSRTNSQARR